MKRCADKECRKLLPLSKFYKYKNGRPHAICIECTKKRASANYKNRPKVEGMTAADIKAWNKAHPINRNRLSESLCVAMSGIRGQVTPIKGEH
ncbi:MAG: hypothetical protein KOO69_00605 [Victivallales bacterium]|nr:hypothetical protein [Victivallales bacterium]